MKNIVRLAAGQHIKHFCKDIININLISFYFVV